MPSAQFQMSARTSLHSSVKRRFAVASTSLLLLTGIAVPVIGGLASPAAAATTVTQTFGFDSDTLQGFTVPADVTSLTITATGGQGGWGGADASGNPPARRVPGRRCPAPCR